MLKWIEKLLQTELVLQNIDVFKKEPQSIADSQNGQHVVPKGFPWCQMKVPMVEVYVMVITSQIMPTVQQIPDVYICEELGGFW